MFILYRIIVKLSFSLIFSINKIISIGIKFRTAGHIRINFVTTSAETCLQIACCKTPKRTTITSKAIPLMTYSLWSLWLQPTTATFSQPTPAFRTCNYKRLHYFNNVNFGRLKLVQEKERRKNTCSPSEKETVTYHPNVSSTLLDLHKLSYMQSRP